MAEHEMQAAELHQLAVEEEVAGKRKGSVDPEKTNLDLGLGTATKDKVDDVHLSGSESDTPDDEEPNDFEKKTLRRGVYSSSMTHQSQG